MGRRGRLEIIADLLEICNGGALRTNMVYRANLNFAVLRGYLEFIQVKGWVKACKGRYHTTAKGKRFLKMAKDVLSEL